MFAVKLLLVLGSITVLFLRGEAAQAVCGKRSSIPTIQALPGKPGNNGAPGEPGFKGERGADGRNGSDGAPGLQGPVGPVSPQGMMGMNGSDGEQGPMGLPGVDGRDGVDGRNGSDGSPGPPGTVSDDVIEQLKEEILDQLRGELNLTCPGDTEQYHASSCKEIHGCNQMAPSAYYWVNGGTGPVQVYCVMKTNNCGDITGGWMRAAYIDLTPPFPHPLLTPPIPHSTPLSCPSLTPPLPNPLLTPLLFHPSLTPPLSLVKDSQALIL